MTKRMSPAHFWLCRAILLLDKLPIPHRYYVLRRKEETTQEAYARRMTEGPYWSWRPGVQGTQFLINRKWFFRFAREYEYRQAVKRSNGQEHDC